MTRLDSVTVTRFCRDLDRLSPADQTLGLAVSGGPDSLAMLLLAAAARPGRVEAATVDHALRPESCSEAAMVAAVCADLSVPHRILTIEWPEKPEARLQARSREERYRRLSAWLRERQLAALVTAHHRGDQAETLLMRLARGAGVRGLAAMRSTSAVPGATDLPLLRPLLDWSHAELLALCDAAGKVPADDPSNRDESFERVRVRRWMATGEMDAGALARSASCMARADEAIEWAVDQHWAAHVREGEAGYDYQPGLAPAEIERRTVARIIAVMAHEGRSELRGGELDRLLEMLAGNGTSTLRGVRITGGSTWRFRPAPPRSLGSG